MGHTRLMALLGIYHQLNLLLSTQGSRHLIFLSIAHRKNDAANRSFLTSPSSTHDGHDKGLLDLLENHLHAKCCKSG